jgi:sugar phosphate isomerase/epimerase
MKLAVSNIAWPCEGDNRAADILRAAGVEGLEVAPSLVWPAPAETAAADLDAYRRRWLDRGIRIVALQALLYGRPDLVLFADAAARARMADHLRAMAHVASRLGAGAMVFGSPANRRRGSMSTEAAMDVAVAFFRALADDLGEAGTVLCIEGNAPAYGCDFLTSTAEAAELVRRVDRPAVRLQIDTSTIALNGGDCAREIAAAAPLAGHVHVSEPHLVRLGTGGTDHVAAADALRRSGYAGWVSMEMRALPVDPDLAGVAAAIDLVRLHYAGS